MDADRIYPPIKLFVPDISHAREFYGCLFNTEVKRVPVPQSRSLYVNTGTGVITIASLDDLTYSDRDYIQKPVYQFSIDPAEVISRVERKRIHRSGMIANTPFVEVRDPGRNILRFVQP